MDIVKTEALSPALQAAPVPDLTACDREPIHIPGAIQPHGLLLVADSGSLEVIGVAGDIEARLATDWTGASLSLLLGRDVEAVVSDLIAARTQVVVLRQIPGVSERFDATMRLAGGSIVVELESAAQPGDADDMLSTLDEISATFDDAHDFHELCNAAALAFRKLTGFDRVMSIAFSMTLLAQW
jgi:chemotaxis family two-component system sensor kinase Cph1